MSFKKQVICQVKYCDKPPFLWLYRFPTSALIGQKPTWGVDGAREKFINQEPEASNLQIFRIHYTTKLIESAVYSNVR